ncbi:MAG: ferredoxin [Sphingobium sp.]
MRITIAVDSDRCTGHARCAMKGPDVYEVDEDGFCISDGKQVTDEALRIQAVHGMKACPERAITINEIQEDERKS